MELMNGFTRQQIGSCISPRKLDLTLLPTEKCNFRCVYCYEEFEHGAMPPHVVEGVCNLITRRAETGLENLSLREGLNKPSRFASASPSERG
jgi:uncharacterized protein